VTADATSAAAPGLERPPAPSDDEPDPAPATEDLLAVVAHSLLSSMAVIVGGTELLSNHWAEIPEAQRTDLLASMRSQARHAAGVLENLVRLGDPELVEALDGLQELGAGPAGAPTS